MNALRTAALLLTLVCAFGAIGNFDYSDALVVEAMEKEARVERELRREIERCRGQGRTYYAERRDREPWRVRCTGRKRSLQA